MANGAKARTCAVLAAVIVSLAISGMHYVAMAAVWFAPDAAIDPMATRHHEHAVWLVYLVSASATAIVLLTLLGTHFQRRLRVSEQSQSMTRARLLEVISALQDGIVLFDDRARIRLCNAAFERMVGISSEALSGVSAWRLDYAEGAATLNERIQAALNRDGAWRGTIEARHRDGTTFPARLGISRVNYADETTRDYVAMLTDISAEVRTRQHIQHLAYHDSLTGLPNRRALQERLDELLDDMRQR
ncbi:PAS domain S-box protein [Halomonas faecis]|uniref:PAS domain S-box protein n=1 Tax=Halomonas faecis TaxID=1562110 RepID=UPI0013D0F073|nr:PAS domain S-box protein [Halomonas faecis]